MRADTKLPSNEPTKAEPAAQLPNKFIRHLTKHPDCSVDGREIDDYGADCTIIRINSDNFPKATLTSWPSE
jgi:hypothetical protein